MRRVRLPGALLPRGLASRLRARPRLAMVVLGALVLLLLLGLDLSRAPERQLGARALLGAIDLYQAHLSPHLARGGARCRFEPSCSVYAETAIERHGAGRGTLLTVGRLLRCGPWTEVGTVDPPPPAPVRPGSTADTI